MVQNPSKTGEKDLACLGVILPATSALSRYMPTNVLAIHSLGDAQELLSVTDMLIRDWVLAAPVMMNLTKT